MDLREVGYDDGDWIGLAQDRDRWRAYVGAAMNLRLLKLYRDNVPDRTARRSVENYLASGNIQRKPGSGISMTQ
ncbi:hypothetical protein ANN_01288 [Periplaneta americana]|uniref:Per a allergen n=1 Tax=Periplaneta americana TaxID=6978 RepID=A0ABQ8TW23_PERAM|nr:hypothetical protein ANN_01288 [Periplaneta americana]